MYLLLMDVSVCFPFRSDSSIRDRNASWTLQRWLILCPEYQLRLAEPDDGPFNRSQAINRAVQESDGDILIIADLDVIFMQKAVEEAVERVRENALAWGFAFRNYYMLTETFSELVREQDPELPVALMDGTYGPWHHEVNSGLLVISREGFYEVGGFDEGFVGWGSEDNAFLRLAEHRWGPHFRIEDAYALHLWHPSNDVFDTSIRNHDRYIDLYVNGNLDELPRWI